MLEFYPDRVLRLSCDRDDRVGAKIKTENNPQRFHQNPKKSLDQKLTPKKSHAKFPSLKISQKALKGITQKINWKLNVCICGWDSRAQPPIFILFWIPQKVPTCTPVNQVTQKNTCQIFPPKRILERKISSPQKSFSRPKYPLGNYKRGLLGTVKAWV